MVFADTDILATLPERERRVLELYYHEQLNMKEVGAVLGVGLARGIEAIDLRVVARIFVSWVVTIPAGAFLAIVFFFTFKTILP